MDMNEELIAIDETSPVTPMTALVIDADGHLTYMGEDGCRRQIVGDPELLARLQELQGKDCTDGDWQLELVSPDLPRSAEDFFFLRS